MKAAEKRNDLRSKTFWYDSQGRRLTISRMDREHAENAAGWLRINAVSLLMQDLVSGGGPVTPLRIAQVLANPEAEMAKTPLHASLTKRARGDGRRGDV